MQSRSATLRKAITRSYRGLGARARGFSVWQQREWERHLAGRSGLLNWAWVDQAVAGDAAGYDPCVSKKHAYLITAYTNRPQLEQLLSLLDDERNDVYLQVDSNG